MSEILTKYGVPCPACWNEIEGNKAVLEILKDWNGEKYIFRLGKWFCAHCGHGGYLTPEAISKLPGFEEVDLGVK
ncbi:MAG: hypothetical protein L6282_01915 [Candidatus Methanoperedenaceae archaeon]|nr:hypothetical protein [Candidatus Methanoperedenaceae archaeon]